MSHFTHINAKGEAQMVDVSEKSATDRQAMASAEVKMQPETLQMIINNAHKKGDVLAVAQIAGIQAAKKTADLIPLCHPLMLTSIDVSLEPDSEASRVLIRASCKLNAKTGVEMEALTAVSVAALTLYDMCKAVDKGMIISNVQLTHKSGGKSDWSR